MENHAMYFLIGASGSGKTTAIREIEKMSIPNFRILYFDSIGVPSFEDMEKEYGSTDEWQRVMTREWVARMQEIAITDEVVLDGQTRPLFIDEACKAHGVENYKIILFDCTDEIRRERLRKRGHPELADERMMNWAKHLREACKNGMCDIIDNTNQTLEQTTSALLKKLQGGQGYS